MRVLFIITQSEIGGAQRYLLKFVRHLHTKKCAITVAAGEGDGGLFEEFSSTNFQFSITERRISSLVRNLNLIKDLLALISILKIIRKEKPNVLFLQSTKAGFLGSLAVRLLRFNLNRAVEVKPQQYHQPKVIYRIGGWSFRDPRAWWMNKILFAMEKMSAPWKDAIIVNSEFDKQLAVKKKIAPSEKIVKIYNGIEPSALAFLTKEDARKKFSIINYQLSITPETKVIGTIANLYATKGLEYLIEAAHILALNPKPHPLTPIFIVIGEGNERSKLESLIKKYNLEDSFFLVGRVPNALRYLKALDVFVLPSVKEGMPWVLLEAMAAEIPIVATSIGAMPEIIENGKEGFLVQPKNSSALAEKIKMLIENPELSKKLSENASEKLKQFSLDKMLEESEKVINVKCQMPNVK